MSELFSVGFSNILMPTNILLMGLGVLIGIMFGSIPGLTATMGIALCLPLTYSMDMVPSMALLCGIFIGGISGGLIPAILINVPGTPSSIATCFDGHPMAVNGHAQRAMGIGVFYSFIGGTLSFLALFFISPPLAKIAIHFGPYEYFSVAVFSLTLIASISKQSIAKGLIAGLIGMAFAMVGPAPIDSFSRYTFGVKGLKGGFDILVVMIGLFAISEVIKAGNDSPELQKATLKRENIKGFGFSIKEFKEQFVNFIRSSFIGIAMGILPGVGGSTSSVLAYFAAKNSSKHPEKFGTGIMDGVVASESANNATIGGAMIPLLTLGIPGESTTAMLLGAFMIHGLTPGPLLFAKNGAIVYSIFAALIVSNVIMLIMEFYGLRLFTKVLYIPKYILLPIIFVLCAVGAFGLNNRTFDIWIVIFFGIISIAFDVFDYPLAPVILGFILGPIAEKNLRSGLMLTGGSFWPFLQHPICLFFIVATVLSIVITLIQQVRKNKNQEHSRITLG